MRLDDLDRRNHAPSRLGSVLILGLGRSGKAAASYCAELLGGRVSSVTVAAGDASPAAERIAADLRACGVQVVFDEREIEGSYDLCIASPGISQFDPFYRSAQAASGEIISEVEFAWRESRAEARWIAVTGTNGKTTTTALAARLLQAAGLRAIAVGNIGEACLDAVRADAADVYVVEVSSYQLASTVRFAPDVAVLLNITPDHLKWHRTHEAYAAAKLKIFENLATRPGAVAVVNAVDEEARAVVARFRASGDAERGFAYIPLGAACGIEGNMIELCGSDNAAYVLDGVLVVERGGDAVRLVDAADLRIKGAHNVIDALAAAAAALCLCTDVQAVRDGLLDFEPLEHRIEPCGTVVGTACFNDSKATNVDAALVALAAFEPRKPIVLFGGDDKGTSLDALASAVRRHCKAAVCFGEAGPRFARALADVGIPVISASHLEDALDKGLAQAAPGDVVILSPACASFDEFTCFEERGDVFKRLVADRRRERGA